MRRTWIAAAVVLLPKFALAEPSPAPSSEPTGATTVPGDGNVETPRDAEVADQTTWYGWQILIVDGAALGLIALGATLESVPLFISGGAVYGLGAPLIHALNGQTGKVGVSFALRIGAPVLVGLAGYAVGSLFENPSSGLSSASRGSFIAGGSVALAASVFDIAYLGRRKLRAWELEDTSTNVRVAPWVSAHQAGASLFGRF